MDVIGIDVGFGFTKASNGQQHVIFKSLLGEQADIQFQTEFEDSSQDKNLHIKIEDESYFVGDLAEKQSTVREFTLDQSKLIANHLKILALTATAACSGDNVSLHVVSGLPVAYFRRDSKKFKEQLTGTHNVTTYNRSGKAASKIMHIASVKLVPQPMGSFFNLLMDSSGHIANRQLTRQKVGIVDIGFRTTDFIILDRFRYIERGSATVDTGISKCFNAISSKLRQRSGANVELYRLYDAVRTGSIRIKGKEYTISTLRDKVYAHYAGSIADDINRLWESEWDLDSIILTGGGATELAKHLQPLIDGNVIPVENESDARLNNVLGYIKYGKYDLNRHAQHQQSKTNGETRNGSAGQEAAAAQD
jgi:plasmid segregation protein ParM